LRLRALIRSGSTAATSKGSTTNASAHAHAMTPGTWPGTTNGPPSSSSATQPSAATVCRQRSTGVSRLARSVSPGSTSPGGVGSSAVTIQFAEEIRCMT
jgi:hypothetical protein